MLKTLKEKVLFRQGLIVIVVLGGLYFFVLGPFLREGSSILDEELERKITEIGRYISQTGAMPSKEGFEKQEKEKEELKEELKELIRFVDPEKVRIAESTSEAGLYFIERLHSSMKRFSEMIHPENVNLPENLGFGDGLPKEELVDDLLRQLEIVEVTLENLFKNDDVEFYAIKPLKSIDYIEPLRKELFYTELPVQISLKTDTNTLIRLLLELRNLSPVISVKEIHIKSSDVESEKIDVSMILSTFRVVRETEKMS